MLNQPKNTFTALFLIFIVLLALFFISIFIQTDNNINSFRKNLAQLDTSVNPLASEVAPGEIIIGFIPGTSVEEIIATYEYYGLKEEEFLSQKNNNNESPLILVKGPEATIPNIIANLEEEARAIWSPVSFVEQNYIVSLDAQPNDPLFPKLWGLNNTSQNDGTLFTDIRALDAWNIETGSNDTIVAIVDTGVDYTHPDLTANIWVNPNEIPGNGIDDDSNGYIDDIHGINTITNTGNPMDDQGHGTHVAGTIAGKGNNSIGVTGVNWDAQIIACKFLGESGSGYISDAVKCFLYLNQLKKNGTNVVVSNNSWSGRGFSQALEDAMSNYDQPTIKPILHVVAAGNSNVNTDIQLMYPTSLTLPNIISVAATDLNDTYAPFSNYGGESVDLAAPGVNILSTVPTGSCFLCNPSGYTSLRGTSMAAPHVTGGAALAFSQFPGSSAAGVKYRILQNVDFIGNKEGNSTKPTLTNGRLNIYRALVGGGVPSIISSGNVLLNEGNSGTVNAIFTMTLSAASDQTVTVNYVTANGTATAGSDYQAQSGTLTFTPGVTSQTISVVVNGDTLTEPDETFFVNFLNPTNAKIEKNQIIGTILSDDFYLSLNKNITVTEPNNAIFTVLLSPASKQTVTVNYATADGVATKLNGAAIAGSDYQAQSGTLTFAPGVTSQTISIPVYGDALKEPTKIFFVNLSNAINATISIAQGIVKILDDPLSLYIFSINDASVIEGDSGTVNAIFTVNLSAASNQIITVKYVTANGTATAGSDYQAQSGTLTFAPGVTSQTINVVVNRDTLIERDEIFYVNLLSATNARIEIKKAKGTGTILTDDFSSKIAFQNTSMVTEEYNKGSVDLIFTVVRSGNEPTSVTVKYATADGTATAGSDYEAIRGTLEFTPGTKSQIITVRVYGDTIPEPDETFFVNLSNPIKASITVSQAIGTIQNDDYSISVGNTSVIEGNRGTVNAAVFSVTLYPVNNRYQVNTDYITADGTATAGSDYKAWKGTLTFDKGVTSHTIKIPINSDTVIEPDETFFVKLLGFNNDSYSFGQGIGTIKNDD